MKLNLFIQGFTFFCINQWPLLTKFLLLLEEYCTCSLPPSRLAVSATEIYMEKKNPNPNQKNNNQNLFILEHLTSTKKLVPYVRLPLKKYLKFFKHCVFSLIFQRSIMTRKSTLLTMFINFLNTSLKFPHLGNEKIASECSDLHINPAAADEKERGCFGKTELGVHCLWDLQDCSQVTVEKTLSEPKKTFLMTVIFYIFMTFNQFIYLLVV